jgi:chromosome segregation ATPase
MEQDLAAERERLRSAGFSGIRMNEQLAVFEQERTASSRVELDRFIEQMNRERAEAEANYQRLRNQYQADISALNNERAQLQEEYRRREEGLRSTLEQNQGVERALTEQRLAYEQAQATLAGLQEQRQKAQAEEQLIIGMFSRVRAALEGERYQDALTQARNLGAYLDGLSRGSSSSVRLETDLYMASSLEQLARAELTDSRQQTARLNTEAETLRQQIADAAAAAQVREREIGELRTRLSEGEKANLPQRITALETEKSQLTQALQERTDSLTAVTESLRQADQNGAAYTGIRDAYTRYDAANGGLPALENFFRTPAVGTAFPGLLDRITTLNRQAAMDGHREGVGNVRDMVETVLRIRSEETRTQYLRGMRERYDGDPEITALVDVLLERLPPVSP